MVEEMNSCENEATPCWVRIAAPESEIQYRGLTLAGLARNAKPKAPVKGSANSRLWAASSGLEDPSGIKDRDVTLASLRERSMASRELKNFMACTSFCYWIVPLRFWIVPKNVKRVISRVNTPRRRISDHVRMTGGVHSNGLRRSSDCPA